MHSHWHPWTPGQWAVLTPLPGHLVLPRTVPLRHLPPPPAPFFSISHSQPVTSDLRDGCQTTGTSPPTHATCHSPCSLCLPSCTRGQHLLPPEAALVTSRCPFPFVLRDSLQERVLNGCLVFLKLYYKYMYVCTLLIFPVSPCLASCLSHWATSTSIQFVSWLSGTQSQ